MKTTGGINAKIRNGTVLVMTAAELKQHIRNGDTITPDDVDVVTTGTFGVMSGTYAVLSIPVAKKKAFFKAERVWLNGVPAVPGPCPNENLGLVDLIVYGTAHANASYGGGHLLRDLVQGNPVDVVVKAEQKTFNASVTLEDLEFARLITTRSAFKNYSALVNPRSRPLNSTIFSVTPMQGRFTEASVSGCGEINPLENDPAMRVIGPGTHILVNGGEGYVMGTGTRSSAGRPNLSFFADLKGMDPDMMGGFITSAGPECLVSCAVPIPVLDNESLSALSVLHEQVPLPVADVADRTPLAVTTYGEVWNGTDPVIRFDPSLCTSCESCAAAARCPTGAITTGPINYHYCVHCGTCTFTCPAHAYHGRLGSLPINPSQKVPVVLRQSSLTHAKRLCERLKHQIMKGEFFLTGPFGE
ncbi:MAG: methanogenesis marker 16 metalloprotein [Methanomicrobiales archaeon]|nr:methanogenesis marker 16 metalloprotein [Methanomicrobiales archaeon]